MAKLDSTDYSDSFEVDLEATSASSSTSELLSQMQTLALSTQPEGIGAVTDAPASRGTKARAQKAAPSNSKGKSVSLNETPSIPKSSALGVSLSNKTFTAGKSSLAATSREQAENGSSRKPPLSSATSRTRFKPATKQAQATHSAVLGTKSFADSLEVRDAVFSEWLITKQKRMSCEKVRKVQAKRQEEEEKQKKVAVKEERTVRALERWNTSKEIEISSKTKQQREEARKLREVEKEKEEKTRASELASRKWREEKAKQLAGKHREKKMEAEEAEERKQQVVHDKAKSSEQAHKFWMQKKSEVIKEDQRKRKQQGEELLLKKQEEALKHRQESRTAFEAWKARKDDKIRQQKRLYTYDEDRKSKVHTRAWCPARSMKHSYPSAGTQGTTGRSFSRGSLRSSGTTSARSEVSSAMSTSTYGSRIVSPEGRDRSSASKLKTIQVCCQTLEYLCTCDDDT